MEYNRRVGAIIYSYVDARSPLVMAIPNEISTNSLGCMDPYDDCLIVFLFDTSTYPPLPSVVTFEIPVRVEIPVRY